MNKMEHLREEREITNPIKWVSMAFLMLTFIIVSSYLGLTYYRPFHIAVEAFSCFIAFSILMMALNTYEMTKNIPFLFLGVAYGFAGGFNIIHIVASKGMGFFPGDTTNLSMTLSAVQRYITAISILICCKLFYRSYKFMTPFIIVLSFSAVSAVLGAIILGGRFPQSYILGYGNTSFKIANEYIISAITILSAVILYRNRKYLERTTFMLLQFYFCTATVGNILLTFYTSQQEITNVLAHILKLISFYFIYRAIVKVGLKTPYKLLFNELSMKDNSLRLKDSELKQAVHKLKRESQLRRNIQDMLIKNDASYKLLIENSRDTIIICSSKRVVFANEGAARLIGVDKPMSLLGKSVSEFFRLDMTERHKDIVDPVYETQVVSIDGRTTPVEITNARITYHSKPAVLSVIRDISSRKQVEKMKKDAEEGKKLLDETLEFNRTITEFFSNISHELRTPLNVILSALQVLGMEESEDASGEAKDKKTRYIRIMKQNCYRLLRLINNLIDITRIDSGYVTPRLQNHNIVSVVEDITLSVAEYVGNKGIEFVFDTDVEEKIIACDPEKIERIMLNLISNAVKFTDEGEQITVQISDEMDNIHISVRDTGIGIPEDMLHVIFERFRQADSSLSRNHEGSGIGLSLVKALVEMHDGSISVTSKVGEGSEFIIKLPVRKINVSEAFENDAVYGDNSEKINIELSDI
jgi:PAS domain S-box-containing protein